MKNLGSKTIETDRLVLKAQTMKEQKYLWDILINTNVNKYYLTVPTKFREKLKNWKKQEQFYLEDMKHSNDLDVYRWSIFLKENKKCIGRCTCHEASLEYEDISDSSIRSVSWYLDPKYQGNGYATEAAKAMIKYMFEEVEISEIKTNASIENPASWKIIEKLGFEKCNTNKIVQYTYLDEPTENYQYFLTKEMYFNKDN